MAKLKAYSTTPVSNSSTPPDGFPEGMLAKAVNNSAREMMARLAEWYQDAQWIDNNAVPLAYSSSQITLTGVSTTTLPYQVGRKIRAPAGSSGTIYTIVARSTGTNTVLTVVPGTVPSLPASIEYNIIDQDAIPVPRVNTVSFSPSGAHFTVDSLLGENFIMGNITSSATFDAPTSIQPGQELNVRFRQDSTGGWTVAFASEFKFANGAPSTIDTTANAYSYLRAKCLATGYIVAELVNKIA